MTDEMNNEKRERKSSFDIDSFISILLISHDRSSTYTVAYVCVRVLAVYTEDEEEGKRNFDEDPLLQPPLLLYDHKSTMVI